MNFSKRLTALFAAVLMAITMFTGIISAYAADSSVPIQVGSDSYSSLTITGWRSVNSTTSMKAQTTANRTAYRIAATIVARNVDSKGNVVKTGGNPDRSSDSSKKSPVASVTSGSGNKFTSIYILYAGLYDSNINHVASTEYQKSF